MAEREWRRGDIVHGSIQGYTGRLIFRGERDGWDEMDGTDSGWDGDYIADIRPLVVIDPEDDAQVTQLGPILAKWGYLFEGTPLRFNAAQNGSCLAAALREFANPTPPRCPASMTVFGDDHSTGHECREAAGHDGAHVSAGASWTEVAS